jgi:hypothetical protein
MKEGGKVVEKKEMKTNRKYYNNRFFYLSFPNNSISQPFPESGPIQKCWCSAKHKILIGGPPVVRGADFGNYCARTKKIIICCYFQNVSENENKCHFQDDGHKI